MQKVQEVIEKNKLFLVAGAAIVTAFIGFKVLTTENKQLQISFDPKVITVPLYERLGGDFAVSAAINRFFDLLTNDKELKQFFLGKDKKQIKQHFVAYLKQLFGNQSDSFKGKSLKEAHSNLHLTGQHFQILENHLVKALSELGIDKREIEDAKLALNSIKDQIVFQ